MEVTGQLHAATALPPGKSPLDKGWVGRRYQYGLRGAEKNLSPTRTRRPVVQPVAHSYTDSLIKHRDIFTFILNVFKSKTGGEDKNTCLTVVIMGQAQYRLGCNQPIKSLQTFRRILPPPSTSCYFLACLDFQPWRRRHWVSPKIK
jgi:hypothetical protein